MMAQTWPYYPWPYNPGAYYPDPYGQPAFNPALCVPLPEPPPYPAEVLQPASANPSPEGGFSEVNEVQEASEHEACDNEQTSDVDAEMHHVDPSLPVYCRTCRQKYNGLKQYKAHLIGKKHKKKAKRATTQACNVQPVVVHLQRSTQALTPDREPDKKTDLWQWLEDAKAELDEQQSFARLHLGMDEQKLSRSTRKRHHMKEKQRREREEEEAEAKAEAEATAEAAEAKTEDQPIMPGETQVVDLPEPAVADKAGELVPRLQ